MFNCTHMTRQSSEKNENNLVLFFMKMVGTKGTKMRWTKACKAAQLLKKMFADNEINPDYFSSDAIYDANKVFQNYDRSLTSFLFNFLKS